MYSKDTITYYSNQYRCYSLRKDGLFLCSFTVFEVNCMYVHVYVFFNYTFYLHLQRGIIVSLFV